jgi:hypothetical protein
VWKADAVHLVSWWYPTTGLDCDEKCKVEYEYIQPQQSLAFLQSKVDHWAGIFQQPNQINMALRQAFGRIIQYQIKSAYNNGVWAANSISPSSSLSAHFQVFHQEVVTVANSIA